MINVGFLLTFQLLLLERGESKNLRYATRELMTRLYYVYFP